VQRQEKRGLRQAIAIDAFVGRFRPRVLKIAERQPLLLVLRHRFARRNILRRRCHRYHAIAAARGVPTRGGR